MNKKEDFLYHGSDKLIEILVPVQQKNRNKNGQMVNDGDPAVCATEKRDIAIFRALTSGLRDEPGYSSGFSTNGDKIDLRLSRAMKDKFSRSRGYLYCLDKKDFQIYRGFEWRSFKKVVPVKIEEVVCESLSLPIRYT